MTKSSKLCSQVFYVPSLGPAPRWASFLDSLTEELEESRTATVYDDYKFITKEELYELGMSKTESGSSFLHSWLRILSGSVMDRIHITFYLAK